MRQRDRAPVSCEFRDHAPRLIGNQRLRARHRPSSRVRFPSGPAAIAAGRGRHLRDDRLGRRGVRLGEVGLLVTARSCHEHSDREDEDDELEDEAYGVLKAALETGVPDGDPDGERQQAGDH